MRKVYYKRRFLLWGKRDLLREGNLMWLYVEIVQNNDKEMYKKRAARAKLLSLLLFFFFCSLEIFDAFAVLVAVAI